MSISTIPDSMDDTQPLLPLSNKWNLFYHLQSDNRWTIESYRVIMRDIQYAESVVALNRQIPDYLLYNTMFFCMKDGVGPTWEDKKNRDGGCFSYCVAMAASTSSLAALRAGKIAATMPTTIEASKIATMVLTGI